LRWWRVNSGSVEWRGVSNEERRHPELVSGSISPLHLMVCVARWMLK
jgi:hypothetical protein